MISYLDGGLLLYCLDNYDIFVFEKLCESRIDDKDQLIIIDYTVVCI